MFGASAIPTDSQTTTPARSSSAPLPSDLARRGGRSGLPDPNLLDGSKEKAEKRSDYGMLGEFDLPGGDQKSDKVGGGQPEAAGGGGQQDPKMSDAKMGGSGAQSAQNDEKGGAGQQQSAQGSQGGGGGDQSSSPGANNSGAQTNAKAGASGGAAPANANGQVGGIQVGELQGDASNQTPGGGATQRNGPPITLGDKAMQIDPSAASPDVVGATAADPGTRATNSAMGKGSVPSQTPGGGNQGAEKGQTMPKGL